MFKDEAEIALKDHGPNIIKPKKRRKRERLRFFFKQFLNKFRILLLIVAIACLTIFLLDQTRTKELTMSVILFVIFFTLSVAGFVEQAKIVNVSPFF
jgi:magnesium-transporting ATPase (P-type)